MTFVGGLILKDKTFLLEIKQISNKAIRTLNLSDPFNVKQIFSFPLSLAEKNIS